MFPLYVLVDRIGALLAVSETNHNLIGTRNIRNKQIGVGGHSGSKEHEARNVISSNSVWILLSNSLPLKSLSSLKGA